MAQLLNEAFRRVRAFSDAGKERAVSCSMKVPYLRRRFWHSYYNQVRDFYKDGEFHFMNLGFASLDARGEAFLPQDIEQVHRFSEQLYRHAIGDHDMRDKDVLEVGCGRGGGSAYVQRQFAPKTLTAVDLAENAIALCREMHQDSGIRFRQADAMALPFADQSFDAVINIESSHCYPSRRRFFAEVARILRPDGLFLYADLALVSRCRLSLDGLSLEQVSKLLDKSRLTLIRAEDISKNVLKARELVTDSNLFEATLARSVKEQYLKDLQAYMPLIKNQFWLKGSDYYGSLESGKVAYWNWTLRKAA